MQEVFKLLKNKFIAILVLAIFDFKLPIVLKTNVFDFAIKVCLSQKYKNKLYLVIYYLYKLLLAKLNYNIYNKELLAIIIAFK